MRMPTKSDIKLSLRPWPKGCSLSAGFWLTLDPTRAIKDTTVSERLLKPSLIIAEELLANPVTSFIITNIRLIAIPIIEEREINCNLIEGFVLFL